MRAGARRGRGPSVAVPRPPARCSRPRPAAAATTAQCRRRKVCAQLARGAGGGSEPGSAGARRGQRGAGPEPRAVSTWLAGGVRGARGPTWALGVGERGICGRGPRSRARPSRGPGFSVRTPVGHLRPQPPRFVLPARTVHRVPHRRARWALPTSPCRPLSGEHGGGRPQRPPPGTHTQHRGGAPGTRGLGSPAALPGGPPLPGRPSGTASYPGFPGMNEGRRHPAWSAFHEAHACRCDLRRGRVTALPAPASLASPTPTSPPSVSAPVQTRLTSFIGAPASFCAGG